MVFTPMPSFGFLIILRLFQVTQFVNGLFESRNNLSIFKNHIRDFLVQSKEFSAQVKSAHSYILVDCIKDVDACGHQVQGHDYLCNYMVKWQQIHTTPACLWFSGSKPILPCLFIGLTQKHPNLNGLGEVIHLTHLKIQFRKNEFLLQMFILALEVFSNIYFVSIFYSSYKLGHHHC